VQRGGPDGATLKRGLHQPSSGRLQTATGAPTILRIEKGPWSADNLWHGVGVSQQRRRHVHARAAGRRVQTRGPDGRDD
jgi:hypothetical protein